MRRLDICAVTGMRAGARARIPWEKRREVILKGRRKVLRPPHQFRLAQLNSVENFGSLGECVNYAQLIHYVHTASFYESEIALWRLAIAAQTLANRERFRTRVTAFSTIERQGDLSYPFGQHSIHPLNAGLLSC